MRNHPTNTPNGPWRLLILDGSDPGDPKWLIATIAGPYDVRPAEAAETFPNDVVAAWAGARNGRARIHLIAMPGVLAWRIGEPDGPGIYTREYLT